MTAIIMSAEVYSQPDNPPNNQQSAQHQTSSNSTQLSNQAVLAIQKKQYANAQQLMDDALLMDPLNYLALFNYASLHSYNNQPEQALDKIKCALSALDTIIGRQLSDSNLLVNALELCPNNKSALLLLVIYSTEQELYSEGIMLLSKYGGHLDSQFLEQISCIVLSLSDKHTYRSQQTLYELIEHDTTQHPLLHSQYSQNTSNQTSLDHYYSLFQRKYKELNDILGLKMTMNPANPQASLSDSKQSILCNTMEFPPR